MCSVLHPPICASTNFLMWESSQIYISAPALAFWVCFYSPTSGPNGAALAEAIFSPWPSLNVITAAMFDSTTSNGRSSGNTWNQRRRYGNSLWREERLDDRTASLTLHAPLQRKSGLDPMWLLPGKKIPCLTVRAHKQLWSLAWPFGKSCTS